MPDLPPGSPPLRDVVRRLLVHARCLGASVEEAEDLVNDALARVLADPDWFDSSRGALVPALKVVVRTRWLNRCRERGTRRRHAPHLRLVGAAEGPDAVVRAGEAKTARLRFLACLEPEERALFRAWMRQRSGAVLGSEAARSVGLQPSAYEAAKKRLRRRCRAVLDELGLAATDLFDPVRQEVRS
ncbi:MAG: DNA-directed RNA polymerase specialized sigma24 family protein [Myxococcota bacterium]|jgi:DNA-directed RNA polymerase specialized sigma24 family protein